MERFGPVALKEHGGSRSRLNNSSPISGQRPPDFYAQPAALANLKSRITCISLIALHAHVSAIQCPEKDSLHGMSVRVSLNILTAWRVSSIIFPMSLASDARRMHRADQYLQEIYAAFPLAHFENYQLSGSKAICRAELETYRNTLSILFASSTFFAHAFCSLLCSRTDHHG